MRRVIVAAGLLVFGPPSASAHDGRLAWLDRSMGHYLVTPHYHGGPYDLSMPPQTSDRFKEHIFKVNPRRYGPNAPVKRFLMEDFGRSLREYFERMKCPGYGEPFLKELTEIMALERLPTKLTADEFQLFLRRAESKRFANLSELTDLFRSRQPFLRDLQQHYGVLTVRDAIAGLRSDKSGSLARRLPVERRELIKQAIDASLADENDWEFCDPNLSMVGKVPEDYLERFGYTVMRTSGK